MTVTLPPVFPMKVRLYILSYLLHRIKSYIRKKEGVNCPHFRANEPQKKYNPHTHTLIFGTDWIMPKHELTRYLDKHLENFLSKMGEHYKMTINKRATEEDVKALNVLGKRLLKKYRRYKAKHEKYEGPVNWITRVKMENGEPVFENPPPDYEKWVKKKDKRSDGGFMEVIPYIIKYTIKNVYSCSFGGHGGETPPDYGNLAFYWLFRIPFYNMSPKLRVKKEKPPPSGYVYLCSCYKFKLEDALAYAEWLLSREPYYY